MGKWSFRQLARPVGQVLGREPAGRPRAVAATRRRTARPALEALECRCLPSTLQAISLPPAGQPPFDTAAGASTFPSVSADGRFVAFTSSAPNLVPGQTGLAESNVFLLDRASGTVTLVSHIPGNPTATPSQGGLEHSEESSGPIISRDGRFIVYGTEAAELGGTTPAGIHVGGAVLYDRLTGQNTLISHSAVSPAQTADQGAAPVAMSGDGRYILLTSYSTDLVPGQVTTYPYGGPGSGSIYYQLFLYDRVTQTMRLVSHSDGDTTRTAPWNTSAGPHALADDGTVVYEGDYGNVFVYDPVTQQNRLLSYVAGQPTTPTTGAGFAPAISGDGSAVAFASNSTQLVPSQSGPFVANVFYVNLPTGQIRLVSGSGGSPSFSADADSGGDEGAGHSSSGGGGPTGISGLALSHDGRFLAFASNATDLVPGQSGASGNVFLYDASAGSVRLLSGVDGSATAAAGGVPNAGSGVYQDPVSPVLAGGVLTISEDGSLVGYVSQAADLVPGQTGTAGTDNIFLYSRARGASTLVTGAGGSPLAADGVPSGAPVLSADGSLLAFHSLATDLVPGLHDANGVGDVFTSGTATGARGVASRAAFTVRLPGSSFSTSTSADGRFTVFTSSASDLVPDQVIANPYQNIFLFDKDTGTVTLVNHAAGLPNTTGDGGLGHFSAADPVNERPPAYMRPVLSADGNWVAFASLDSNLVPGEHGGYYLRVYLYNRQTGQVQLVNHVAGDPTQVDYSANFPVLSADGRYVAYCYGVASGTASGGGGGVTLYDRVLDQTTHITPLPGVTIYNSDDPSISDDGRFVAFVDQGNAFRGPGNVYVYSRDRGVVTLVSHDNSSPMSTTPANLSSSAPVISHDGSAIAFASQATNLVPGQVSLTYSSNVFLYQNDTSGGGAVGPIRLVSGAGGSATVAGDSYSDSPAIDGDGTYVAYRSDSTDLVPGQTGPAGNIYEFNAQAATQTLASHRAGDPLAAVGGSSEPVIDADGHLISYVSTAGDLVPGQTGAAGVKNVFVWLRPTNANILASGQDGSPTDGGDADSDFPLLTRHSFPGFSSKATLLQGVTAGSSVAYINTLVALALSPNVIADGSAAGSLVGYLTVSSLLLGQYLPPVYRVPGADTAPFTVGAPAGGSAPLLTRFLASYAAQSSYEVSLLVDVGFGFDPVTLQVLVAAPSTGGGGGSKNGPRPIEARLVPVKAGRKKSRLMVEVFDAATGALKAEFLSPFQQGAFRNVVVSVLDTNHDGIPDEVVITARKGKKKVTATRAG